MEVIKQPNIIFISDRDSPHITFKKESLTNIELPQICCLDLETTGLKFNVDEILLVILGDEKVQYVVDYLFVDHDVLKEKMNKVGLFIGHNLSFDLPFLIERGFSFNTGQIYDTMETELSLVKGTSKSVSLQNTTDRRLNFTPYDKGLTIVFTTLSKTNPHFTDSLIEYGATDILYLKQIKEKQEVYLDKFNQRELAQLNNDMVVVVSYMKVRGIFLNKDKWMALYNANLRLADELELKMDQELASLGLVQKTRNKMRTSQLDAFGDGKYVENKNLGHINYSSSDQIKSIFSFFNLPVPKISKKEKDGSYKDSETTGAKELEEYLLNNPKSKLKNFLQLLIKYKVIKKQLSTYGKGFIDEHCDSNSFIHPTYKVNRTATGRLASANPNAQNIPRIKSFRECFEGRGENLLWTCDLSSAELRILASLADDKKMKDLYNTGEDLHSYLATPVYRYIYDDPNYVVTKKLNPDFRTKMKTINFGIAYGSSAGKVAKILDIPKAKAERVLKIMRSEIPHAFEFLEKQERLAQTVGIITFDNILNQRRYFEEVLDKKVVPASKLAGIGREGKNVALQGLNSQMIKLAMVRIFDYIRTNNLKSMIVLSVHDELVIEFPPEELPHTEVFEQIMIDSANRFLNGLKMEVEKNIGKCWDK